MYYETNSLFSSTKSRIYNKDKRKQAKLIISFKSTMDLNKFLFDTSGPKIVHIQVYQDQVESMYLQSTAQ